MDYSFDIKMATEIGVEKAVLLKNIVFWIRKNEANKMNYFDGSYWTYNSANAFTKLFPFWSAKKIYNMLKWLTNNDYLKEGNYNKVAYDRTKWYALSEKSITYYSQFHFTKSSNGIDQMVKPIPDINSNNKPNIKTDKSEIEKSFDKWWNLYNNKKGKPKTYAKWEKLTDAERAECLKVVKDYVSTTPEVKYRKYPLTYLNGGHWEDELQVKKNVSEWEKLNKGWR